MNSFAGYINYTIGFKALFIMVVLSAVLQRFFGDLIEIFLGSSPETPPLRFPHSATTSAASSLPMVILAPRRWKKNCNIC